MKVFTVYMRHGCHLCEDLIAQLCSLQSSHAFEFITVDVDADPSLTQQYGPLVPVVVLGDQPLCHYFLDQAALLQALNN